MRVAAIALLVSAFVACGGARSAAQRDPMRCERDPGCGRTRGSYSDCSQQCADNPECMDRCREAQTDRIGHP